MKKFLISLCVAFVITSCGKSTTTFGPHAWIQAGDIGFYKITNEKVTNVGKFWAKIVSTDAHYGYWSNSLSPGTQLYKINQTDPKHAIAVEIADHSYVKAIWQRNVP